MKTIYTLFPEVLNLNGDSANSLVLQKNLQWMGEEAEVISVSNQSQLSELIQLLEAGKKGIFVTIGHGSAAGMKSLTVFDEQLKQLIELLVESNTPAIVVGSALIWASVDASSKRERKSEFVVAKVGAEGWPEEALGYLNSELSLEPVQVRSNVILSLLHGPFLAKNPTWVDQILHVMGANVQPSEARLIAQSYVDEIWRLESNH
jgi:hypothetical protein